MKIRCQCGAIYNVPETTGGKKVTCKKCQTTFLCPTPPPKPATFGAADQSQNVPGTFVSSPYARSKRATQPAAGRQQSEDAILKKYMSEDKSLEERMADRRQDSIDEDRTSNSLKFIIVGSLWIVGAVVVGAILWGMTEAPRRAAGFGGRRRGTGRAIMALLYWSGGKYWAPPLLALYGIYKITIGIMSLAKKIDIESEEQLPTRF